VTLSERSNASITVRAFQGPNELHIQTVRDVLVRSRAIRHNRKLVPQLEVPQLDRDGESECTNGHTNIDCNSIGVPHDQVTGPVDASAYLPLHRR
jgi:hypothetical protein